MMEPVRPEINQNRIKAWFSNNQKKRLVPLVLIFVCLPLVVILLSVQQNIFPRAASLLKPFSLPLSFPLSTPRNPLSIAIPISRPVLLPVSPPSVPGPVCEMNNGGLNFCPDPQNPERYPEIEKLIQCIFNPTKPENIQPCSQKDEKGFLKYDINEDHKIDAGDIVAFFQIIEQCDPCPNNGGVSNSAPVIETTSLPNLRNNIRIKTSLEIQASDIDGDAVQMSVTGLPFGVRSFCKPSAGAGVCTLSGTPLARVGTHTLTVTANDGQGNIITSTLPIRLTN